jgi:ribosome maturation factor RimP
MTTIDLEKLRSLVTPVVAGLGYELVDLEWKFEGSWVLRLFVDGPQGISHGDCARVSRAVSAELDVADPIEAHYTLEVSSPGLNRPLRAEADFQRFAGKKAKIKTRRPLEPVAEGAAPQRNFKGKLLGAEGGRVRIEVDGREVLIPVADVEKAHLEYEF